MKLLESIFYMILGVSVFVWILSISYLSSKIYVSIFQLINVVNYPTTILITSLSFTLIIISSIILNTIKE
jgi:hypothetical protein